MIPDPDESKPRASAVWAVARMWGQYVAARERADVGQKSAVLHRFPPAGLD